MVVSESKTKDAQENTLQEKLTESRRKEIETRLNQLGIKAPDYLSGMMNKDLKDIDMCFLE